MPKYTQAEFDAIVAKAVKQAKAEIRSTKKPATDSSHPYVAGHKANADRVAVIKGDAPILGVAKKAAEIDKATAPQGVRHSRPTAKATGNDTEDIAALNAATRTQMQRTIGALDYGTGGHSGELMIGAGAASVTPVKAKHAPSAADVRQAGGLPPNARMDGDNPDVLVGAMRAARAAR